MQDRMAFFKETLKMHIQQVLPLSDEKAEQICNFLIEEHGVENFEDLSLLTDDDLKSVLKTVQRKKLLLNWIPQNTSNITQSISECDFSKENSFEQEACEGESNDKKSQNWLLKFSVPWEKMPVALMKSLNEQKRPTASQRREMVRVIADAIRKFTTLPGIKAINHITKSVVQKYPSLKDTLCGDIIFDGNCYLSKQVRNRLENLNRGKGVKRQTTMEHTVEHCKRQFSLSDRYGCSNWQPLMTEEEEIDQEKERNSLFIYSQKGPVSEDDSYVSSMISKTYPLQRKYINKQNFDIALFRDKWPCLFSKVGLLKHFYELVGIDLQERFEQEMRKKGSRIIDFLKTVPPGSNKKELIATINEIHSTIEMLDNDKNTDLGVLLKLLAACFGEDIEAIFKSCETTADQLSLQRIVNLPCTPCILVCGGSMFESDNFIMLIDGIVVNDTLSSYYEGFLLYIASYFVFNIKYPETVGATMEFVQSFQELCSANGQRIFPNPWLREIEVGG